MLKAIKAMEDADRALTDLLAPRGITHTPMASRLREVASPHVVEEAAES